jgi:hypothetical protein
MNGYWNFHHNRSLSHDAAHGELGEANLGLFECSAEEYSEDCGGSTRAGVSGRVRQHCYPSRSPYPGVAATMPGQPPGAVAASPQARAWPAGVPAVLLTATVRGGAAGSAGCRPPARPARMGWLRGARCAVCGAVACWDRLELVLAGRAVARLPG